MSSPFLGVFWSGRSDEGLLQPVADALRADIRGPICEGGMIPPVSLAVLGYDRKETLDAATFCLAEGIPYVHVGAGDVRVSDHADERRRWMITMGASLVFTHSISGATRCTNLLCACGRSETVVRWSGPTNLDGVDLSDPMGGEKAGLCLQRDCGKKIEDWDGLMRGAFGDLPMTEDGQALVKDGERWPFKTDDLVLYNPPGDLSRMTEDLERIHAIGEGGIVATPNGDPGSERIKEFFYERALTWTVQEMHRAQFLARLIGCTRFFSNSSCVEYEARRLLKPSQIVQIGKRNERFDPPDWREPGEASRFIAESIRKWMKGRFDAGR